MQDPQHNGRALWACLVNKDVGVACKRQEPYGRGSKFVADGAYVGMMSDAAGSTYDGIAKASGGTWLLARDPCRGFCQFAARPPREERGFWLIASAQRDLRAACFASSARMISSISAATSSTV